MKTLKSLLIGIILILCIYHAFKFINYLFMFSSEQKRIDIERKIEPFETYEINLSKFNLYSLELDILENDKGIILHCSPNLKITEIESEKNLKTYHFNGKPIVKVNLMFEDNIFFWKLTKEIKLTITLDEKRIKLDWVSN